MSVSCSERIEAKEEKKLFDFSRALFMICNQQFAREEENEKRDCM